MRRMRHWRSNVHGQPVMTVLRNVGWLARLERSRRLGRIENLVHAAGSHYPREPLELRAVLRIHREFGPQNLAKAKKGRAVRAVQTPDA